MATTAVFTQTCTPQDGGIDTPESSNSQCLLEATTSNKDSSAGRDPLVANTESDHCSSEIAATDVTDANVNTRSSNYCSDFAVLATPPSDQPRNKSAIRHRRQHSLTQLPSSICGKSLDEGYSSGNSPSSTSSSSADGSPEQQKSRFSFSFTEPSFWREMSPVQTASARAISFSPSVTVHELPCEPQTPSLTYKVPAVEFDQRALERATLFRRRNQRLSPEEEKRQVLQLLLIIAVFLIVGLGLMYRASTVMAAIRR